MQAEHPVGLPGGVSKRIGINAHLLSSEAGYRRAGIHQYIAQVLHHLPWEEDGPAYILFSRYTTEWEKKPGFTAVSSRLPTEKRAVRILWEQVVWPWLEIKHKVDLSHSMAFVTPFLSRKPSVVTVYDLSFLHFPESFPALQRKYLTTMTRRACQKAKRVITISESSKQDVHQFFNIPLAQIDVILPGVDDCYRVLPDAAVQRFRDEKGIGRFLLHVGTLQPRKNITTLIEAFAQLPMPDLQLVLVGGKGWLYDQIFARIQALGIEDSVIFTGYVPDEELPLWYNAAELFVFPSVYEGFGMPVVEAMACGTPVVASNSSSIPEAVGAAGLLVDPYSVAQLVDRITAVLNDSAQQAIMKEKGGRHARNFSWERAGLATAVSYQRALENHE